MKHLISLVFAVVFFGYSCSSNSVDTSNNSETKVKVGVFDGHGGSQTCVWEAVEAIKIDKEMDVRCYYYTWRWW